jgi:hypothetical protein
MVYKMNQLSQADTRNYGDFEDFPEDLQVREFPLPYDPTIPDEKQPDWVPKKYPFADQPGSAAGTLSSPIATPTADALESARLYDRTVPIDVIEVASLMAEVCGDWPKAKPYVRGDDMGPPQPPDEVYESHVAMCSVVRDPAGHDALTSMAHKVEGGAWALGGYFVLYVLAMLLRLIWRKAKGWAGPVLARSGGGGVG